MKYTVNLYVIIPIVKSFNFEEDVMDCPVKFMAFTIGLQPAKETMVPYVLRYPHCNDNTHMQTRLEHNGAIKLMGTQ